MKRCPQCSTEYSDATQFCSRDGSGLEAVDPIIGRVIGGRYRVLSRVGTGGMGAVYRGEHVKMRRVTAIKVLTPALASSPEFVARFQREAELASTLSHPHAVAIYDFGEDDGLVYLAMEFLDGEPLSALLARRPVLPLDLAIRIARQAAEALDAAHRRGIVHRDFKPDNVMLVGPQNEPPVVKVVDFGIAKQTEGVTHVNNLTQTGSVLGTPTYMSPEQVADRPLDARSDLYSLALTVYQMLAGTLPFRGETIQSIMVQRLLESPIPLGMVAPGVPPAIEAVVMRALSREPHQRQASVLEFAVDLERAATATSAAPAFAPAYPTPLPPPSYPTPIQYPGPTQGTTTPGTAPGYTQPVPVPTPTPAFVAAPPATMAAPPRPSYGRTIAAAIAVLALLGLVLPVAGYGVYLAFFTAPPQPASPVMTPVAPSDAPKQTPASGFSPPSAESVTYLVQLSRDLWDREDYEQAEQRAREAVKLDPKSPAALVTLCDILLDESKNSEAAKLAEQALDLDRKNPAAHRAVAECAYADRQFGKAVDEAKLALKLGPGPEDEAFANLTLGAAYYAQTLYDPALDSLNRARTYTGRSMVPIVARMGIAEVLAERGNADAGVKDLLAIAGDPQTRPNMRAIVNIRIAKLMLVESKPADCVTYCDKALQTAALDNVRAAAKIIQGLAYIFLKRPADALSATEQAVQMAGEDKELQGYGQAVRGAALVMLGRVDEGRAALAAACQILPDEPNVAQLARQAGVQT